MEDLNDLYQELITDEIELEASETLGRFFDQNREEVFFSRQLEVMHERDYFHWITNRAIRSLEAEGLIRSEWRKLKTGTSIKLIWHKENRFYKRSAKRLVSLVDEYSDPNIGASLGLHGEMMVLEGFARSQFVMRGRSSREHAGKVWTQTDHDLDFIFERDGIGYGVEVKNTLGYMDSKEFLLKIALSSCLGLRPVFVCRMLPKSWIFELQRKGGFALILKYQLYPWAHNELARRVARELRLPVDAPRALEDGTMKRFLKWHLRNL